MLVHGNETKGFGGRTCSPDTGNELEQTATVHIRYQWLG